MSWTEEALEKSLLKIERNIVGIGEYFPHVEYDGIYNDQGASFWTSGFWPGMLWLLYQEKKDENSLRLARRLERRLDEVLDGFISIHHDVGFMWLPSAVIDYKLTGSKEARIRGLKAASHLAGRV
ncbi:MAG: glycoside hydrolase family 88 protein, partial [Lacrimispora sphenoides]